MRLKKCSFVRSLLIFRASKLHPPVAHIVLHLDIFHRFATISILFLSVEVCSIWLHERINTVEKITGAIVTPNKFLAALFLSSRV